VSGTWSVAAASAADAAGELLAALRLPPLVEALQDPAARVLSQSIGAPGSAATGLELSLTVGGQQWTVVSAPLPQPPKLLQLPSAYQVRCSGQPALMCFSVLPLFRSLACPSRLMCVLRSVYPVRPHPSSCLANHVGACVIVQAWYISLGQAPCSSCGQVPQEPALCLRCGALLCCASRTCQGLARQVSTSATTQLA
jgi:hypothetical protein